MPLPDLLLERCARLVPEAAVLVGLAIAAAFLASPSTIDLKKERQGEAIAYSGDGQSFFTLSEGKRQPIHEYIRAQGCH